MKKRKIVIATHGILAEGFLSALEIIVGKEDVKTMCCYMEMQWINSSVIHSDEFFNGPFEITEKDTAYLMLKSTGKTREVDDRAIRFLNKFNAHTTIIDGYDYGMKELGTVSEYFDHSFYSELLGVYNHLLADRRQHPLSWRKYMWKFAY